MATKTMAWKNVGSFSITLHTASNPTDEEWDAYLQDIAALGTVQGRKVLVVSKGGGPNSRQRQRLVHQLRDEETTTALLTSNMFMRGVGTAIGWFNRLLKVFSLNELEAAFDYLQLGRLERERVTELIRELEQELDDGPRVANG